MQTLKAILLVEPLTIYNKDNQEVTVQPFEYVSFIDIQARDKVSVKFKYNDKTHWCFRGELYQAINGSSKDLSYANHSPVTGSRVVDSNRDEFRVIRTLDDGISCVVRHKTTGIHTVRGPNVLDYGVIRDGIHEIDREDNKTETINGSEVKVYPRTKIVEPKDFAAFKKHLSSYDKLAFDTETTGLLQKIYTLDDREDFVVCFTVSTSSDNGYYIRNDKSAAFKDLLAFLCTKHLIMHNAAFDLGVLKAVYDLEPVSFDDTMIMYKCMDDSLMSYGLKSLIDEFSTRGAQLKLSDFSYLDYVELGMYDKIEDIAAYYACYDTSNTFLLYNKTIKALQSQTKLYKYYRDVEIASIIPVSVAININGLKVDTAELAILDTAVRDHLVTLENEMRVITQPVVDRLNVAFKKEQEPVQKAYSASAIAHLKNKNVIKTAIEEMLTEKLTINCADDNQPNYDKIKTLSVFHNRLSTRQTGIQQYTLQISNKVFMEKLLYSHIGFDLPMQVSATGKASINKSALNELGKYIASNQDTNPELLVAKDFFAKLSEFIKTKKLLEAFITPSMQLVKDNKDGKLHPNYNLFGTVSSRASCNSPNFQQLASNKQFDIRKTFVVDDPNSSFIQCDFNAQEVRVMAALSQDPTLLKVIRDNIDLHCETVRRVWADLSQLSDDEIKDKHKDKRTIAKVVFFSLSYGARAKKMAFILGISEKEAEKVLTAFKQDAYPVLTRWLDQASVDVEEKGYADIYGGYRRVYKPSGNKWADMGQVRSIVNSLIQGASAYITKVCTLNTLRALSENKIPYKLIILIHDSITLQIPDSFIEQATKLVEEGMSYDFNGVPVNSIAAINKDMSKETELELADFLAMMEEDE